MEVRDDRLITLKLLNFEIFGSFIGIIGLSVFIFTSISAENIILKTSPGRKDSRQTFSLDVAALVGRIILVTAGFLAANTTTIRLNQLTQKVKRNEPLDGTLFPNIWLTIGIWTSFAGGIIALMGDYQRVKQSPRIPIQ